MAIERHTLSPDKVMVLSAPQRRSVGKDIGVFAILVLLVLGELHVINRIGQMRSYVDLRDSQLQAGLQHGFQNKLDAASAAQNLALESATKQTEGRILQMEGRTRLAEGNANQATQQLVQMQSAEDSALLSIRQMLEQKASAADIRALSSQMGQTRLDVDLSRTQVARLRDQVGRIEEAVEDQITALNDQLAEMRHASPRFLPFRLVVNQPQAIGGIALLLTRTRQKTGNFDLRLTAGTNRLERKNAAPGEPIFFVPGDPQKTYEVVVDRIGRNEVNGFLGAPAQSLARTTHR